MSLGLSAVSAPGAYLWHSGFLHAMHWTLTEWLVFFPFLGRTSPILGGIFALRAHCALLLDYVPPEEPPSTPLRRIKETSHCHMCVCQCNPYNIAVHTCHTWTSFQG